MVAKKTRHPKTSQTSSRTSLPVSSHINDNRVNTAANEESCQVVEGENTMNIPHDDKIKASSTQTQASDVGASNTLREAADTSELKNTAPEKSTAEVNDTAVTKNTAESTDMNEAKNVIKIENMFGSISKHYDILNHLLSFGVDYWWRHRLVNSIILGEKANVLDMAAGTLDVSLAILRKYPQAQVVAGDICEEMLKYGEHKIRSSEKTRIDCQVMDAEAIPHADESFDAVTIAFGIRNVNDRLKALREMNRVLVNGGQLCILEFSPITTPYIGKSYHWYLENVVPKISQLFGGQEDAYTYLAKSIQEFPSPQDFCKELKNAGFTFIRHESLTFGIANLYVAIKT